jgi:hypothetical protein
MTMSMSNRGLIKSGKRVLVVVNGRLGSAAKNGADVTMFGPDYGSDEAAVAYGLSKFGKVAVPYVKREPVKPAPAPAPVVEPAPVDSKPLGILPPPDTSKPKPLSELRVPELRALCKANGLKGYSKLAKAGLIEMLTAAKVAA